MRKFNFIIILIASLLYCTSLYSQSNVPTISLQNSYGGSGDDFATTMCKTSDGGYIVAGKSHSNDKDVSGHHGSTEFADGWVIKFNAQGAPEWKRSYGGSDEDGFAKVRQTSEGGYILIGSTNSTDGDAPSHHGGSDNTDVWIVKLSPVGDTEWTRSLGGSNDDNASDIRQTADLGYIIAATSNSNDGDLTSHHGSSDFNDAWFIKLDKNGKIQWQHSYGGTGEDNGASIVESSTGYLALGFSSSNDGDASGHHGSLDSSDFWLLNLDATGQLVSQKQLGGSGSDIGLQLEKTSDQNFLAVGLSLSTNGDVTSHKINNNSHIDSWIVKINASGNIIWQNSVIGINESASFLAVTSDGGSIISALTYPSDSVLSQERQNGISALVVKFDQNGNIQWQGTFPGDSVTGGTAIIERAPNSYALAGLNDGVGHNVTKNNGGEDYWVVEFTPPTNAVNPESAQTNISLFPNPTDGIVKLEGMTGSTTNIRIMNLLGETVLEENNLDTKNLTLDLSKLIPGTYYIRFSSVNSVVTKMVVRE